MNHEKTFEAINKLKEIEIELHRLKNALEMTNRALEAKDEPVGWIDNKGNMICTKINESCRPLYTTPQRKWVGLTDEDMNNALDYWSDKSRSAYGGAHAANGEYVDMIETWRYIEAKLKERNA